MAARKIHTSIAPGGWRAWAPMWKLLPGEDADYMALMLEVVMLRLRSKKPAKFMGIPIVNTDRRWTCRVTNMTPRELALAGFKP